MQNNDDLTYNATTSLILYGVLEPRILKSAEFYASTHESAVKLSSRRIYSVTQCINHNTFPVNVSFILLYIFEYKGVTNVNNI